MSNKKHWKDILCQRNANALSLSAAVEATQQTACSMYDADMRQWLPARKDIETSPVLQRFVAEAVISPLQGMKAPAAQDYLVIAGSGYSREAVTHLARFLTGRESIKPLYPDQVPRGLRQGISSSWVIALSPADAKHVVGLGMARLREDTLARTTPVTLKNILSVGPFLIAAQMLHDGHPLMLSSGQVAALGRQEKTPEALPPSGVCR